MPDEAKVQEENACCTLIDVHMLQNSNLVIDKILVIFPTYPDGSTLVRNFTQAASPWHSSFLEEETTAPAREGDSVGTLDIACERDGGGTADPTRQVDSGGTAATATARQSNNGVKPPSTLT